MYGIFVSIMEFDKSIVKNSIGPISSQCLFVMDALSLNFITHANVTCCVCHVQN